MYFEADVAGTYRVEVDPNDENAGAVTMRLKDVTADNVGDVLHSNQHLEEGQALYSRNGHYKATQQTDGNFVVYNVTGAQRAVWVSSTNGSNVLSLKLLTDGNLVQLSPFNQTVWSTGTAGQGGTRVVIRDDGNLVMIDEGGEVVWSSGTASR